MKKVIAVAVLAGCMNLGFAATPKFENPCMTVNVDFHKFMPLAELVKSKQYAANKSGQIECYFVDKLGNIGVGKPADEEELVKPKFGFNSKEWVFTAKGGMVKDLIDNTGVKTKEAGWLCQLPPKKFEADKAKDFDKCPAEQGKA